MARGYPDKLTFPYTDTPAPTTPEPHVHRPDAIRGVQLKIPLFINGIWQMNRDAFEVRDPATHDLAATVAKAGDRDLDAAVSAASMSFARSRDTTPLDRYRLLTRVGELMNRDHAQLAALLTLETGKPLAEARGEVAYARDCLLVRRRGPTGHGLYYAIGDEARRATLRESVPLGVILAVVPWNYPLVLLCRKLFAAIAAGNTAIVKPSRKTPIASAHLMRASSRKLTRHAGW